MEKIAVILQNCKISVIVLGLIVAAFITAEPHIPGVTFYKTVSNDCCGPVPIVSGLLGPGAAATGSGVTGGGLVTGGAAVVLVSLVT